MLQKMLVCSGNVDLDVDVQMANNRHFGFEFDFYFCSTISQPSNTNHRIGTMFPQKRIGTMLHRIYFGLGMICITIDSDRYNKRSEFISSSEGTTRD